MEQPLSPGLYIVATPIGNLGDVSMRAVTVLGAVAAVACEDTRVTGKLLQHIGVKQKLIRYDDHASEATREHLLALAAEQAIALVSDAPHPAFSTDLAQEALLQAANPLTDRPVDRSDNLMLGGSMMPYLWTIDGKGWGKGEIAHLVKPILPKTTA